jgi:hypothetical protein
MESNDTAVVRLGWLWFDNDPKTSMEEKLAVASQRYRRKFGAAPKTCYVSHDALSPASVVVDQLRIRSAANVLPGHFLFVVDEELKAA